MQLVKEIEKAGRLVQHLREQVASLNGRIKLITHERDQRLGELKALEKAFEVGLNSATLPEKRTVLVITPRVRRKKRQSTRRGETKAFVRNYLAKNGPSSARRIFLEPGHSYTYASLRGVLRQLKAANAVKVVGEEPAYSNGHKGGGQPGHIFALVR